MSDTTPNELAKNHWRYVKRVIINSEPNINHKLFDIIEFHYITAFEHGYKHGCEETKAKQDK